MKYPTLTRSACLELSAQMVAGHKPSIDPHVEWVGLGPEIDLAPISEFAADAIAGARAWPDRDRDVFEGQMAPRLQAALAGYPVEVLDDRGFWRFIALKYFWDFIAWREDKPFSKGNHLKYVDASSNTEAVLPRMYLRAHAVGGQQHAALAAAIPRGTDFWRSHVLRVRTGSAPPVSRAFVARQAADRLMTEKLREAARRLNRNWTNLVLYLYDDKEAQEVVDSIWKQAHSGEL